MTFETSKHKAQCPYSLTLDYRDLPWSQSNGSWLQCITVMRKLLVEVERP